MNAQTAAPRKAYVTRTASGIRYSIYSATGTSLLKTGTAKDQAALTNRVNSWQAEIVFDKTV